MLLTLLSSCMTWMCMADMTADFYGLDRKLVRAVIAAESGGRATAVSRTRDYGIMQVNIRNIKDYRVFVDVRYQIIAGVEHLKRLKAGKFRICRFNIGTAATDAQRELKCAIYANKLKKFGYVAKY